jgi:hypothetical protein
LVQADLSVVSLDQLYEFARPAIVFKKQPLDLGLASQFLLSLPFKPIGIVFAVTVVI